MGGPSSWSITTLKASALWWTGWWSASSGTKIADSLPDEVLADEQVRRVYLGSHDASTVNVTEPASKVTILELKDVSVHYGKAAALQNVSLDVAAGAVTAVVGLNGAGKTTLFSAIWGWSVAAVIFGLRVKQFRAGQISWPDRGSSCARKSASCSAI